MIKFYQIPSHSLKVEHSYTFVLYLYDLERNQRIVALYPETQCTAEMIEEWQSFEAKGAYLQISVDDKELFLNEAEISEKNLLDLNEFYFKMAKKQEDRLKLYKSISEKEFHLRDEISKLSNNNDYKGLIDRVKAEVLIWPLTHSTQLSMVTELVDKLFVRDIMPVRVATMAYLIAKLNNLKDQEVLGSIIVASLFKELGLGLINAKDLEKKEKWDLNEDYEKYPMLSLYVLSKTTFEVPKLVKRFILEQHEQYDGSGFPRGKKDDYIHIGSYIINLASQIIYYQSGRIKGTPVPLVQAIELFHNQTQMEGLNLSFPTHLMDSLSGLIYL